MIFFKYILIILNKDVSEKAGVGLSWENCCAEKRNDLKLLIRITDYGFACKKLEHEQKSVCLSKTCFLVVLVKLLPIFR